jgi:Ala-tRNA(Pro) deacylase
MTGPASAGPDLAGAVAAGRGRLAALFERLGIAVAEAAHPAVFTVDQAAAHPHGLPGEDTKNLLLRDAKGGLFLLTLRADRRADLKALPALLGARRFSFASATVLAETLGVAPGAVTPLALVNDATHQVSFALDRALAEADRIICHPLVNTASVSIATADLRRLLDALQVPVRIIDLDPPS